MKTTIQNLPEEVPILHQIIVDLVTENRSLKDKTALLEHQLALLRAKQFGKSSEKLGQAIDDLEQQIEDQETEEAQPEEEEPEADGEAAPEDATAKNPKTSQSVNPYPQIYRARTSLSIAPPSAPPATVPGFVPSVTMCRRSSNMSQLLSV